MHVPNMVPRREGKVSLNHGWTRGNWGLLWNLCRLSWAEGAALWDTGGSFQLHLRKNLASQSCSEKERPVPGGGQAGPSTALGV